MSDYLSRLAARLVDPAATLKPRLPGRFESLPVSRPALDLEGADVARMDAVSATPPAPQGSPPTSLNRAPAGDEPPPGETFADVALPHRRDVGPSPQPPQTTVDRPAPRLASGPTQAAETPPKRGPAPVPRPPEPPLPTAPYRAVEVAPPEPPPALTQSVTPRSIQEIAEADAAPLAPSVSIAPRLHPADSDVLLDRQARQPTATEAAVVADVVVRLAQSAPTPTTPVYLKPAAPPPPPSAPGLPRAPQPTVIRVTIGRIEVRAVTLPPVAPPAPRPAPRAPSLSLDDYLKERRGGKR